MKKIQKSMWCRIVTMFMIHILLIITTPQTAKADDISKSQIMAEKDSMLLVICVLAIAGIIVGIGGCAAKKLLDKLPPPETPPPPPPPPPPPSTTNAPPAKTNRVPRLTVDANNNGIQSWDISSHPAVVANPTVYSDPSTGLLFTHIYTTSIQGQTSIGSPWHVAGSRVIWLNESPQNGSAVVLFYDGHGNPVRTNYYTASTWTKWTSNLPSSSMPETSSVELMDWEVGNNKFFRLGTRVDNIGILTE